MVYNIINVFSEKILRIFWKMFSFHCIPYYYFFDDFLYPGQELLQ
jgi:hypothetical protein